MFNISYFFGTDLPVNVSHKCLDNDALLYFFIELIVSDDTLCFFSFKLSLLSFGIIWAVNPKLNSTSLILTRIFSYISSTILNSHESPFPVQINGLGSPGPMAALSFLTEIYANAEKSNSELSIDLIKRKFEKLFPTADTDDIFTPEPGNSDYDNEVTVSYWLFFCFLLSCFCLVLIG